ncbi:MAG: type II secretion system F family protein, partial [Planctomycetes bacterium]|nr:type II secretion system F family protein [Planctomycetota bacterium]
DAPSGPLRDALSRLADDVERGVSLSKAVQAQPAAFPELFAAAVEAGEASNSLPDVLSRFSRHCRMVSRLRARAWQAAAYPVVILVFSACLITFILAYFLPHLRDVQHDAEGWWDARHYYVSGSVPRVSCVTTALYWVSDHLAVVALMAGVGGLLVAAALVAWWRDGTLQKAWEWLMLRIPWTRRFVTSSRQARFCRTLGLLLKAGVPLPRALTLATRAGRGVTLADGAEQVGKLVESGMTLSTALTSQKLFSDALVWTIEMGEKRGNLPETLLDMADLYEEESEYAAGLLRALLPLVFFVAVLPFIGSAVGAVMSPLFYMMRLMGCIGGPPDERQTGPGDLIAWVVALALFYVGVRCVLAWQGGTLRQRVRGFVTRHLSLITRRNL